MKFCKHRVMDRCRKNGRPCTFSKECFEAEEVHETNADRIRAMSDEELACQFGAQCPKGNKRVCDKRCHICWLEWLQQPAKDGDGDG